MPSSYSTRLRLELQADGENSGTWGQRLNTVIQLIEEATDGYAAKAMADANVTLTATNGASDESRQRVIKTTGALTAQRNVVVPTVEKYYLVWNGCTGFGVQWKTTAGTGIVVPVGAKAVLFCDGTNVEQIMLLSTYGQTLIDDVDAATARTTLGLGDISVETAPLSIAKGGSGQITAALAFGALKQDASEAATGVLEIATEAEIETGTDTVRAITPGRLTPADVTWTGAHVFSGAVSMSSTLGITTTGTSSQVTYTSTDGGATAAPSANLDRDSASPAAADAGAVLRFRGRDSGGNMQQYVSVFLKIFDPTNASENGALGINTIEAGTQKDRWYFGGAGGGFYAGDLTDPGDGKVNALDVLRSGNTLAWDVLEEQTASASAALDFVLTGYTDYEDFEFIISNLIPSTDATNLWMRFSSDGGVSYDAAAASYAYMNFGYTAGGIQANNSASDTHMELNGTSTLGTAAGEEYCGTARVFNTAGVKRTQATWTCTYANSAVTAPTVTGGGGQRLASQDTDAIRFMMSAGNIASGKITLLGRRKAV